jgi:tetratricopeptide (TPR) repeat protein
MKKLLSVISILVFFTLQSSAIDYNRLWKQGNAFYEQRQYDSAAYYFEQIAVLKPQNAEVYYNLGNTYYRLNKIAPAVLNYERALRINPGYKEAKDNLALAQGRISNHIAPVSDIFFVRWWESLTAPDMVTAWAVFALVAFIVIIAIAFAKRFQRAGSGIPVQVQGILGLVCFCFLILAFSSARSVTDQDKAVVMENDAPLMSAEQKGKPLMLVPEGTTVKILNEKGMWVEVSLPDGRSGWLQQDVLDKI